MTEALPFSIADLLSADRILAIVQSVLMVAVGILVARLLAGALYRVSQERLEPPQQGRAVVGKLVESCDECHASALKGRRAAEINLRLGVVLFQYRGVPGWHLSGLSVNAESRVAKAPP